VDRLARDGAEVGLLASSTPHIVFEALSRISSIPLLSIVEAACAAARELHDLAYVHEKYGGELVGGDFRVETRERILGVIDRMVQAGADGILLAGTELPLLLRGARDPCVPLLDTTRIHVARAVAELLR
jgi:aspartate/glutamate racemase